MDLHYIEKWSLSMDLKILFETPRKVLKREGAF
jgi:lipopolysaccharide/colanic/teichoic acid biosynthesis glycosyltransferase